MSPVAYQARKPRPADAHFLPTPAALLLSLVILLLLASPAAALERHQVLLIVNTSSPDSTAIRDAYVARHGEDVRIWQYAGSTSPTISRETFESEIRAPLDDYLTNTVYGKTPLSQIVRALVTTKGVPRRIDDYDNPGVGDRPADMATEYNAGKADAASVDAELVLLHQRLLAGPSPQDNGVKYYANNYIRNPYYQSTSRISSHSRAHATSQKNFNWQGNCWLSVSSPPAQRLTPGDIYLVCRLSGYTAQEAIGLIDRGSGPINVYPPLAAVVIDRDARSSPLDGNDYPQTRDLLANVGLHVNYDNTAAFITQAPYPVLGYTSYGRNHSPSPARDYILTLLDFEILPGAAFNTFESFNGRNFETADPHDWQGQAADWVRIGGTLAFGHVWEPFAFAVAANVIFYDRMLIGTGDQTWTFAEAAYAAMPALSWQNIVIGDPLTQYIVRAPTSAAQWQTYLSHGQTLFVDPAPESKVIAGARGLSRLRVMLNKEPAERTVNPAAISISGLAHGNVGNLVDEVTAWQDNGQWILDVTLSQSLPDADRYTISLAGLRDTEGYPFYLNTVLQLAILVGDVDGSGVVDANDVLAAKAAVGQTLGQSNYQLNASSTGRLDAGNLRFINQRRGACLPD